MGQAPCLTRYTEPINIHIYSEVLQKFRLAAQGKSDGKQPPDHLRERVETHFDPLPFLFATAGGAAIGSAQVPAQRDHPAADGDVPLLGFAECLAAADSYLQLPVREHQDAREAGIEDGGWMWVESMHGKVRCLCRYSEAVEPGTVWTWNAIGKASGAWGLDGDANEAKKGFLLNHLISEELPPSRTATTCPTRTRLPARPAGTTCTCGSTRPTPTSEQVSSPQFDTAAGSRADDERNPAAG